ncbi:MAG: OmpA family protein [Vicinamibacterales bacterium]
MHRESVRITSWVLAVGALSLAVGCGKKQPPTVVVPPPPTPVVVRETPPPQPPPAPPVPPPVPTSAPVVMTEDEVFAKWTIEQLNEQQPLADVLFDYDSAELNEAGRTSLQKNTVWLQRWITTGVRVEGHADSRGTNEYNFALSERRAASVRDYLVSLGVSAARVSIVSKGEEQPTCTDETEGCWTRNRRAHFVFTAK